ncbi:MAG: ABC transporter permease, partial [Herbinix sp.]|nr:ABC transporter permease [Herbinix sp.]
FQLSFYPVYGLGGFGLFLIGIVGATILACIEMLHKRPAELMRPKTPKEGSRILLERIPFIWKRLNFLNKVTCRNLFRYKKRVIMTIVGILGCMMLIVLGFGVRDTVGGLMSDQYGNVTVYDAIVVTDKLKTEEMDQLVNDLNDSGIVKDELQIHIITLTLLNGSDNMDITVMVIPDSANLESYVHLKDTITNKKMPLPTDGIVVTQNAAKQLKLKSGDTISLQNEDNLEYDFPVAFVTANNAGNYVYISKSCYQAAFGDYAGTSLLLNMTDNSKGEEWLDKLSEDNRILTVSSSQDARDTFGDVKKIINMVVYLLISMSAVLALTVLFTLSNINISERERELATMKVLGFRHKEVYSYVNKETFILTLLGILLGMPAGYGITYAILANVSIAEIAFNVRVSAEAYLTAAILTMIFTLLVNKITNKTLRQINMVEALKSVE